MTRPKGKRCISYTPCVCYFKPEGVPRRGCEEIVLLPDELEALRLADATGLDQIRAAKKMKISQPTFARIIGSARKKVAEALVSGKAIRIAKMDEGDGV